MVRKCLENVTNVKNGKNVNFRKIFKIILISENSFMQMHPNEMSFLTYQFLRIKWLFAKSVEITKETAIHKNRFLQSSSIVYSLVIEETSVAKSDFCNETLRTISNQCLLEVIMM